MIFFTERILANHDLQMVVCFVANDISGSPKDGTPKEVLRLFKYFIKQVRTKHPEIPIMQIAITPTQSRWNKWSEINEANELIKAYCAKTSNLYYIDTVPEFLDAKGQPKPEWFVGDQLHLNKTGYAVWSTIIRAAVEEQLPTP
jgi:lysophospholipase L1-like esterase